MHGSYNVLLTSDAIADPVRTVVPQISIGSEGGPFIPSAGLGYDVSYGLSRRVRAGGGYHISDNSLLYAGIFKGNIRFNGSVYDSGGTSIETFDGYYDTAGYVAGLHVKPGDHFFFGFEWVGSSLDFTDTGGSASKQGNFYGWRAGYNF